jgi:hypothetical protein
MRFNINNYIRVQLTDRGREIHHERWLRTLGTEELRERYPYRAPDEDSDGWSRWQAWDFMATFGPHLGVGMNNPASPEIIIETESN